MTSDGAEAEKGRTARVSPARLWVGAGVAVAVVIVAVVLVARGGNESGDRSAAGRPTVPGPRSSAPADPSERLNSPATQPDASETGTSAVPTSSVPAASATDAQRIVDAAAPDLPLTAAQVECLVNRLAGSPELLDAVGDAPSPGTEGFGVLVREGEWCITSTTLAPAFVDAISESLTAEPSAEQRQCLALAYTNLTEQQRQTIFTDAFQAGSAPPTEAQAVLDGLLGSCDAERRR